MRSLELPTVEPEKSAPSIAVFGRPRHGFFPDESGRREAPGGAPIGGKPSSSA
jgi:hypothetical protein